MKGDAFGGVEQSFGVIGTDRDDCRFHLVSAVSKLPVLYCFIRQSCQVQIDFKEVIHLVSRSQTLFFTRFFFFVCFILAF